MNFKVLIVTMTVALALVGCGDSDKGSKADTPEFRGVKDDTFIEIMDSIDLNTPTNTSLNVKTSWDALKGQEVKWEMEVVDVKSGRGRIEIYAKKEGKPLYRGYNIIVITYDTAKAGALKKGQTTTIRGIFEKKSQRKGHPMVLYIGSAQVVEQP